METLDELQGKCRKVITVFNDERSDIQRALILYKSILISYHEKKDIYNEEKRDYILNHFLEESVEVLMKREHRQYAEAWNIADDIASCCKLLVSIAIPLIKEDADLAMRIIYYAMNSSSPFFTYFGHDWRQKRGCELSDSEKKQLETWRISGIQKGANVDYLMANRWRYGQIQKIEIKKGATADKDLRLLHIQPLMEGMYATHYNDNGTEIYTHEFTLNNETIAQITKPLTKSVEQKPHMMEWRKNLRALKAEEKKQPDNNVNKCDVLDPVHKWYTCTVIQDDTAANRVKISYDGWSSRYDDWIPRDSMNLQPYLSHAKGGRETQGVTGCLEDIEPCLEDAEDIDSKDVYALWRGKLNSHSFHLIDILNVFGKNGGFDAILNRLKNSEPIIPMAALRYYISPFSKVYKCYTRKVAETFVKPFMCLTLNILESLGENELKDLTKDYLTRILESVELLMKRYHTEQEVVERMEKFQLLMALKRVRCLSLDRRQEAAQYISYLCAKLVRYQPARVYSSYSWLTQKYLAEWMKENNVLYTFYGPSNEMLYKNTIIIFGYIRIYYNENDAYLPSDVMNMVKLWYNEQPDISIMKQSVDVLHFACAQNELQFDHAKILWNIIERITVNHKEEEDLYTICEVMMELLDSLDEENIDRLITKIQALDLASITSDHLKVISVAMKTEDNVAEKCFTFLWNVIQDDTKCEESLIHSAIELLITDIVNIRNAGIRDRFMQKCIHNLKQHQSVYIALKLLSILLKNGMNETERYMMIEHLIDNEKLLKYYLDDVLHFKKCANQQIAEQSISDEVGHDSKIDALQLFATHRTYLEEIKQRVKFVQFLQKNYQHLTLSDENKTILYSQFIEHAATNEERKIGIIKLKAVIAADDDKYPLLQQQINEDSSENDDYDDNENESDIAPQPQGISNTGVDPAIFAALGYTNSDDAEAQLLYQSLMESQAELYQSFQQ